MRRLTYLLLVCGLCSLFAAASAEEPTEEAEAATSLEDTEYSLDGRSLQIRDLRLGEPKVSVRQKYPKLSPLPGVSETITLPEGESLYVKFSFNRLRNPSDYSMYLSGMSFRQNLGEATTKPCNTRLEELQSELLDRFGRGARITHVRGLRRLTWDNKIDDTSKIIATIYCRLGALIFGLGAEGEYIDIDIEKKMDEAREKARLQKLKQAEERRPKF